MPRPATWSSRRRRWGTPWVRSSKVNQRGDLEDEFGLDVRDNEGEAANHGIFYDDSGYDYMQHMRDFGAGDAFYIEAAPVKGSKGKGKRLEDALRDLDVDGKSETRSQAGLSIASSTASTASMFFDDDQLPSEFVKRTTYQDMHDVPDAIAGFQPDMDLRLREVLEALEDEAYVDDDEDIFSALQKEAEEVDSAEFEADTYDLEQDDEGWESDHTVKAADEPSQKTQEISQHDDQPPATETASQESAQPSDHGDGAWMAEFSKFKKELKATKPSAAQRPARPAVRIHDRVEPHVRPQEEAQRRADVGVRLLHVVVGARADRRAEHPGPAPPSDKMEEEYAAGDDEGGNENDDASSMLSGVSGLSKMSGLSKASGLSRLSLASGISAASASQAPKLVRADFDSIMDDFLGKYHKAGKKSVRRGKPQTGLEQLEEIRRDLGPARLQTNSKA